MFLYFSLCRRIVLYVVIIIIHAVSVNSQINKASAVTDFIILFPIAPLSKAKYPILVKAIGIQINGPNREVSYDLNCSKDKS